MITETYKIRFAIHFLTKNIMQFLHLCVTYKNYSINLMKNLICYSLLDCNLLKLITRQDCKNLSVIQLRLETLFLTLFWIVKNLWQKKILVIEVVCAQIFPVLSIYNYTALHTRHFLHQVAPVNPEEAEKLVTIESESSLSPRDYFATRLLEWYRECQYFRRHGITRQRIFHTDGEAPIAISMAFL